MGVTSALVTPTDVKNRREKAEAMRQQSHRGRRHGGKGRGRRGRGRGGWGMGRALVDGYIQTDVTMYPGFSGGALVSGDGKVHGLNTSGFSRGVSIAVPVATIRKSVAALLSDGKIQQGYLGIGVQPARLPEDIADELDQDTGLLVVSVEKESPAATAGLMVGDIVTALDDEPVEHVDELLILLASISVGTEMTAAIVRGGESKKLKVTIGSRD